MKDFGEKERLRGGREGGRARGREGFILLVIIGGGGFCCCVERDAGGYV